MAINLNKGDNTPNKAVNSNETVNETVNDQTTGTENQDEDEDEDECNCDNCKERKANGQPRERIIDALGIPDDRSKSMIRTVIDTIEKMDADGKDINRASVIRECAKTLPSDMSTEETLYMGFVLQEKAEGYVTYLEGKKLQKAIESSTGFKEILDALFK